MREHLGTYGSPVGPPHLGGETPEDTEYVVFGGTSRRDTFYANNNFGIHAHALDEEGSYLDDSTRVCRDPGPVVAVEERAYRSWLRAFEVSGRFEALLERAAR